MQTQELAAAFVGTFLMFMTFILGILSMSDTIVLLSLYTVAVSYVLWVFLILGGAYWGRTTVTLLIGLPWLSAILAGLTAVVLCFVKVIGGF